MTTVKNFKFFNFLFVFVLVASMVSAVDSPFLPIAWWGYVEMDGANASAGMPVELYLAGNLEGDTTTPTLSSEEDNHYYLSQVGLNGNSVEVRVCGISAYSTTWQVANSGNVFRQDLSVNRLGQGADCDYACACTGGFCINAAVAGKCSNEPFYCDEDSVCEPDYSETSANCPNDCPSSGGGGGGGGGSGLRTSAQGGRTCEDWSSCVGGQQSRECTENDVSILEYRTCSVSTPVNNNNEEGAGNEESTGGEGTGTQNTGGSGSGQNQTGSSGSGDEITGAVVGAGVGNDVWYFAGALGILIALFGGYFFWKKKNN